VPFTKRRTKATCCVAVLSVMASLLVGCGGARSATQPVDALPSRPQRTTSSAPTSKSGTLASPFAALGPYLAGRSGQVTAAVYDGQNNRTWSLHPGQLQDTASIVKVEIMGTALQQAQAKDQQLSESAAALMPSMIENSDNQSATTLFNDVGGASALADFDRSAGMTDTTPSNLVFIPGTSLPGWGLTITTALDQVTLVSKFAYPNTILSDASREYGLSLMENVEADQNWGISGGVPAGVTVALKNGWLPLGPTNWQVNSIGWILGDGRNYVLAILTTGSPTEAYGIATIEAIASTTFADLGEVPP
jgi:beta-lactamase class A